MHIFRTIVDSLFALYSLYSILVFFKYQDYYVETSQMGKWIMWVSLYLIGFIYFGIAFIGNITK